jgi:hypothetical protein
MKPNLKLFAVVALSVLAGVMLKSDRGRGQESSGPQLPVIIRQISLENQTATPQEISLFTPTTSGLYRISVYFSIFPGATGSICPIVSWRDASSFQISEVSVAEGCVGGAGNANGVIVVHSKPNEPVNLVPGFGTFSGSYNLFATVEQLQ